MSTIYISGPMSGIEGFNFPAFNAAAALWREAGWTVLNPAENAEGSTERAFSHYIRIDLGHLLQSDAIAMLPGWEYSRGACLEARCANALALEFYDAITFEPITYQETILDEAQRLVYGKRGRDYGHPKDDWTRVGRMWGAMLGIPDIPPAKAALMMTAVKISRECNRHKRDSLVDIAGYAQVVDIIEEGNNE